MSSNSTTVHVISGSGIALGIALHLDSGFWNIFVDAFLGWIYVGYKLSQLLWPGV